MSRPRLERSEHDFDPIFDRGDKVGMPTTNKEHASRWATETAFVLRRDPFDQRREVSFQIAPVNGLVVLAERTDVEVTLGHEGRLGPRTRDRRRDNARIERPCGRRDSAAIARHTPGRECTDLGAGTTGPPESGQNRVFSSDLSFNLPDNQDGETKWR